MAEDSRPTAEEYIKSLERSNKASEKAIRAAIGELGLFPNCNVLDIPCGIGNPSQWMAEEQSTANIVGIDISEEHLLKARMLTERKKTSNSVVFLKGNINNLEFEEDTFDFIWCCDGLWPGAVEIGCLAEDPYEILSEMVRVSKDGGTIAIVFWSSQKLLPGYPLLEARLNTTLAANIPVTPQTDSDLHFMRAPLWLEKTGLKNIKSRTFAADINGPFNNERKKAMLGFLHMFWGAAETELSPEIWEQYKTITNPDSDEFIFNKEGYAGFITYTMFTGSVVK
ncbi:MULTISPECIES: class I SAM-dependent methyltransferase [unclassified Oceanispirochaeta]|uniref:class I SAM-dependent methyltransferase n=1 Tax=unclassified Oceanispirochaeta TaxID=2635722 RepID=UPI001314E0AE|nr:MULTISPECIES: class I SAM-dependent methyltransferase [unclassified Oceanispirochaeta]MBF9016517.1 class I SAM-dependent methyltransferase [Oceanispirochaeta sp. M2]NPD72979.1 class I SAM-dependent methyltransferase [Oceanispirochaeta sp. M1]